MRNRKVSLFSVLSTLILVFGILPTFAAAQIVSNDFEDGTLQGWIPRGPVTLTNSTAVANTGVHSLLTTGRTAGFNGPSLNLFSVLTAGQLYIFKVSVRMQAGQTADTLKMTMQSTINGSNSFTTVATSTTGGVTDAGWVTLTGSFTPTSTATAQLLYVEAASATSSYYIDTFSIATSNGGCANPPDNSGFSSDFESGALQGWTPNGSPTLTVTTADAHSGTHSLLATNRTSTFMGPLHDATGKMCNGSSYKVEVWVKMAPGQPDTQLRVRIRRTLAGTTNFNTVVANATVTSGAWVRLKTTYPFAFAYDALAIYVESNNNPTASFYIDDFSLQFSPPPTIENIPSVGQAYAPYFKIGWAGYAGDLSGVHAQLAALHHTSVTAENDMKWDTIEPTQGNFNFVPADNILNFAKAHGIAMRGHPFVWHSQAPAWIFQDANGVDMSTQPFSEANKQLVLSRMKNHIRTMIQHYGADIYAWDVVNEAFDESQPSGFRTGSSNPPSKWYQIVGGPEFIDDAFIYARQALDELGINRDQVKLCYNDYSTTVPAKRDFIYNYFKDAIARGVPIDCIGQQFHNNLNWPIDDTGSAQSKQDVIDAVDKFASLGLTNHITEFDISIYRVNAPNQTIYHDYEDIVAQDQADLILLGYRYRDYFSIFKSMSDKISSVTLWGQADDHTWRTSGTTVNAPLLFDINLQHKYAYTGIMSPLDLPGADLETTMSADNGSVTTGHPVTYTITVTNHGHNDAANLQLSDTLPAGMLFQSMSVPGGWSCSTPNVGVGGTVSCSASALTNGSAAQFTLVALLDSVATSPMQLVNVATVTSSTLDPNLAPNNTAMVVVEGSTANVVPGLVQIISTATVSKLGDGSYQATVKVWNRGAGTAQNLVLNSAILGAATGTPIPLACGNVSPGGYVLKTISFPASAGLSGSTVAQRYTGSYTGGTFVGSLRTVLP